MNPSIFLAANSTVPPGYVSVTQANKAIAQVAATFETWIIILIILSVFAFALLGIYIYGMGPFRRMLFYKGPLKEEITPDNGLTFRKMKRLRKQMFVYVKGKTEFPFRAGLNTGYSTAGGPRIYISYSPSEMAIQVKLLPWIHKVEAKMKEHWKYTPQSWEQLCLLSYKDYIDRMLNNVENPVSYTERIVLRDDKTLIEEIETKKPRPYLNDEGRQILDTSGRPVFYQPHSIDDQEALYDRAEAALISENPSDLSADSVDVKDAVLFRRSTFTDNDLSDAYQEGYLKAQDTRHGDNTKIFVMGMAAFFIFIGAAVLLTSIHVL